MANLTLILGEVGSGKTTSLRDIDPRVTVIINIIDKPLPFKNYKKNYFTKMTDGMLPNYFASDNAENICRAINKISKERLDIKCIVIDDFGYLMSNEYFARAHEKGFAKFGELGQHTWKVLNALQNTRTDINCVVMAHNELTNDGKYKIKTIGKMLDEKYTIEGIFPHVFHAIVRDGEYKFLTRNDGTHIARNPFEMFESDYIDNDLKKIFEIYDNFYGKEDTHDTAKTD